MPLTSFWDWVSTIIGISNGLKIGFWNRVAHIHEEGIEFGISRCKLLYTGLINNQVLLYNTRNYIQYPIITRNRKIYEKE